MKYLLYIGVLAAVWMLPSQGTDVGKLIPVEVIAVSENGGLVHIAADTGDRGEGASMEEALKDLKDTAPGVIYLDTAEYLLIEPGITGKSMTQYLKGSVRVYQAEEGISLEGIGEYLSVHQSDVKLKELTPNSRIPVVHEEKGRYRINKK